jgi:ribosomal-protein-alanine N-acetyltransferase
VQGGYQLATIGPRPNPDNKDVPYNTTVLFSIRDFHKADFETLWRIDQSCFAPGISYSRPELFAYITLRGSFTLVAERNPEAERNTEVRNEEVASSGPGTLGFVVASLNSRGAGHVITIDVIPGARRIGVGSALLTAAEQRLRSAGSTCVRLETAVNNSAALAFYKRHGYTVFKTIPRYYPDGLDAFVMQKNLRSQPPHR